MNGYLAQCAKQACRLSEHLGYQFHRQEVFREQSDRLLWQQEA
jgi:hypothetical protein